MARGKGGRTLGRLLVIGGVAAVGYYGYRKGWFDPVVDWFKSLTGGGSSPSPSPSPSPAPNPSPSPNPSILDLDLGPVVDKIVDWLTPPKKTTNDLPSEAVETLIDIAPALAAGTGAGAAAAGSAAGATSAASSTTAASIVGPIVGIALGVGVANQAYKNATLTAADLKLKSEDVAALTEISKTGNVWDQTRAGITYLKTTNPDALEAIKKELAASPWSGGFLPWGKK